MQKTKRLVGGQHQKR
ncbi:MAG: hypothetical protein ACKO41_06860 [Sphingomonadales bacterium]